jgi:hypothetical protein
MSDAAKFKAKLAEVQAIHLPNSESALLNISRQEAISRLSLSAILWKEAAS